MTGFTRRARSGLARCAISAAFEARITLTTLSTLRYQQSCTWFNQVTDLLTGIHIEYDRADRNRYFDVFAAPSGAVPAGARRTAVGTKSPLVSELGKGVHTWVGQQPDRATIPPIATVGTAEWNILFATETDRPASSVAGIDSDCGFVDEFHNGKGTRERSIYPEAARS